MRGAALLASLVAWSAVAVGQAGAQDGAKPSPPPLEVNFSSPIEGEADVRLDTVVRIQFSRDVDPASLEKRIRVQYSKEESAERGEAQPPAIAFAVRYDAGTRALVVTPTRALERFRQVTLELLDGIVGKDGAVLQPWKLNFSTGGS